MVGRLALWVLALLTLLGSVRGGVADDAEGGATPYALYLPGAAPENVAAVRVVGFEDGRIVPVAGARLTGWSEEAADWATGPARLLVEGTSDEHGFVNLTWPADGERPFHWLAEAPGKAVRIFSPHAADDVHLARGAPYTLRVLGPMGEPLADARVEYYIYGCPHSPSARIGTTNAEGLVVFDGFPVAEEPNPDPHNEWGQFWITAEGVAANRHYARSRRPDGSPGVVIAEAGASVHGSVQSENGHPLPGIVVRQLGYPRGPATTTDPEGRFRLQGVEREVGIAFHDPSDLLEDQPNAVVAAFEEDVPVHLTLRKGRAAALGEDETTTPIEVEVRVRSDAAVPPSLLDDVPVRLVRLSDGLVVEGETGDPTVGLFSTLVPPGRYRVRVGGAFSPVLGGTREVDLPCMEPVRFVLDKAPGLSVRGLDPQDPEWVGLRLPFGMEEVTEEPGQWLSLPPDVPALVQLFRGEPVLVPVAPPEDGIRQATVPAASPTRVRFRVCSADPEQPLEDSEARWADDQDWDEEGDAQDDRWTLSTWRHGRRQITVWCRGFQETTVDATIRPEDGEVDLGDVLLHPLRPHPLRVLHADGTVPSDLSLHWGVRGREGNELQESDGTFPLDLGPRPLSAVLRGEGVYPRELRISTQSPAEIRLPGGRLDLDVRDAAGRPLAFVAYVDHVRLDGKAGACTLRGIPTGPHTVIVGARDHLGSVQVVTLGPDESRTLELTLPAR